MREPNVGKLVLKQNFQSQFNLWHAYNYFMQIILNDAVLHKYLSLLRTKEEKWFMHGPMSCFHAPVPHFLDEYISWVKSNLTICAPLQRYTKNGRYIAIKFSHRWIKTITRAYARIKCSTAIGFQSEMYWFQSYFRLSAVGNSVGITVMQKATLNHSFWRQSRWNLVHFTRATEPRHTRHADFRAVDCCASTWHQIRHILCAHNTAQPLSIFEQTSWTHSPCFHSFLGRSRGQKSQEEVCWGEEYCCRCDRSRQSLFKKDTDLTTVWTWGDKVKLLRNEL